MLVIHVPVSTAVKKYFLIENQDLLIDHNSGYGLKLNQKTFLGNLVHLSLTADLKDWKLKPPPKESLVLILSKRYQYCTINEKTLKKLAYHLDQEFKKDFCRYIDMAVKFAGISGLRAVENFCRNYGIEEDDYGQDNMYRYYTRYGKKHHVRPNMAVA